MTALTLSTHPIQLPTRGQELKVALHAILPAVFGTSSLDRSFRKRPVRRTTHAGVTYVGCDGDAPAHR